MQVKCVESASGRRLSSFIKATDMAFWRCTFIYRRKIVASKAAEVAVVVVVGGGVDPTGLIYNACVVRAEPTAKQSGLCFAYSL